MSGSVRQRGMGAVGSGPVSGVRRALEKLDAFPKFTKDFREQTTAGAVVSIVTLLVMLWLIVCETAWWLNVEVRETMEVNHHRNEQLKISFDISFPSVPCSMVSIDSQDVTGQRHENVLHNIFKRRVDASGVAVGRADAHSLGGTVTTGDQLLEEKTRAMKEGRETLTEESARRSGKDCGSCYGAGSPGQCCSTCDEVKELYRQKGWSFDAGTVQQCKEEGVTGDAEGDSKDGCNVYGFVMVPAVAGQLHFAPASEIGALHDRIFDLRGWTHSRWNSTHQINKLSFGPFFAGRTNPLDGVARSSAEQGMIWNYYVKVVPTDFSPLGGTPVQSHQYSVTDHSRVLGPSSRSLPGVHFSYDVSPIKVRIAEERHSFGHFLVGLSAIIGGVYTIAQLLDGAIYSAFRRRIGLPN
ncbi:hypothetical protein FNF27_00640 [Cafeteria roenbergensis]|uniref:Endoplasmic reticulum vesicle transporter C-terminal domain-containing protein n=1 Tax=Cafeteria roenbergensis TaxID=33653 RepID=A0A5A8EKS3_CAFRO|nr:hypothetical protein FNF29_00051 [Cafeteria roenbergensis]KAA0166139.1 hypothetical protein FNF28_03189 [Cafeteria roenbergensis]KAA0178092.1 hypothetical protein FNF27_00640 [Cafeteria roenbergensis]|eukprot:KAA0157475.1 hypothetical protein FNF29_00051 [Cafeteria roenbergensis]